VVCVRVCAGTATLLMACLALAAPTQIRHDLPGRCIVISERPWCVRVRARLRVHARCVRVRVRTYVSGCWVLCCVCTCECRCAVCVCVCVCVSCGPNASVCASATKRQGSRLPAHTIALLSPQPYMPRGSLASLGRHRHDNSAAAHCALVPHTDPRAHPFFSGASCMICRPRAIR
jgi:hypothetical protein